VDALCRLEAGGRQLHAARIYAALQQELQFSGA
jgi:hypothetical protein